MQDKIIGSFIGEYEIISLLGIGGMGAVYRARQFNLMREVAIKILPREFSSDPEYLERFLREARAAAHLNHPHIVQVYDAGVFDEQYFFVMELAEGHNVGEIIRKQPRVTEEEALRIVLQAALGLGFAHQSGIIHRDVKPENLIRNSQGVVKICDLGLAKWGVSQVDQKITQSGMTLGTPHYIAPEQVRGVGGIDHRADIYSLGATFYHILTAQQPFDGASQAEIMIAHLKKPLPDPRAVCPEISERTVLLLQRMTQKDPAKRFQSMEELADEATDLLGTSQVQSFLSPDLSARLVQRHKERGNKPPLSGIHERAEQARRLGAIGAVLAGLTAMAGAWFYYESHLHDQQLKSREQQIQREAEDLRVRLRPIEIKLPTEVPASTPRDTNHPAH